MKKPSANVMNVKKLMQDEAYVKRSNRGLVSLRVGKEAVREELGFLTAILEKHMCMASEHALSQKRKTIQEEDIIFANGINRG